MRTKATHLIAVSIVSTIVVFTSSSTSHAQLDDDSNSDATISSTPNSETTTDSDGDATNATGLALARSSEAVEFCNATDLKPEGASVPEVKVYQNFATDIYAGHDLKCGNGRSWGAVKIERKHKVNNWNKTIACIRNVLMNAKPKPEKKNKWTHVFYYDSSWALVTRGDNGIITAFPSDSGSAASWADCAAQ